MPYLQETLAKSQPHSMITDRASDSQRGLRYAFGLHNVLTWQVLLNKRRFETSAHLKAIANEDKRSAASIRNVI